MEVFQHLVDKETKEILASDFPQELIDIITEEKIGNIVIRYSGANRKCKVGFRENALGNLHVVAFEERYINSSKLFRDLMDMIEQAMITVINFKNTFSLNQNEYVQGLLHNLTSINTYNIQDIFALIPQQVLTENLNTQHQVLRKIVAEQPNVTANTLLKLIKSNYAMKIEFSVFEKTVMKNPNIQKSDYSIREIVLSILQIFIDDFENHHISVSLDSNPKRLFLDYDTLFVSLYYILENAVKYCMPSSKFKIFLVEDGLTNFALIFDMISIKIDADEITKLTTKNYRSTNAVKLTPKGAGIGMHRVLKTLRLNNAKLEIIPRYTDTAFDRNGNIFEHNRFKVIFDSTRII
jgi:hypothetical protein